MNFTRRQCILAIGGSVAAAAAPDQLDSPVFKHWYRLAKTTDGTLGVAALHLGTGKSVSINGDIRFPLASVCKVPIAMNMLALVDEGKFALDQEIEVLPRDVVSSVSPLASRWPTQRRFQLNEMLELMVARSDNTAVETLFRIGGEGPAMATRFTQWKIDGVRVDRSERQCSLDRNGVEHYPPPDQWNDALIQELNAKVPTEKRYQAMRHYLIDPRDTGTPNGTAQMFARLFRGEYLSKPSTARVVEILKATTTFPNRIKGLLPKGTVVAHKTGSTGAVKKTTAGTNDSGVIFLPHGGQLAVSVYLKDCMKDDDARDRVIANAAKIAFDAWNA